MKKEKIAIYNLEPKLVNIALEKIKMFYKKRKYKVEDFDINKFDEYSKVFCSSIFTFTNKPEICKNIICGGTGFDIFRKLPEEIENMKPKLNFGFTTRGCIRDCYFCFVPKKEGKIRSVGDIYDFWDRKSKFIKLLDNNILALPNHFRKIAYQIIVEGLKVDFNQGLDIRLLTEEKLFLLKKMKHDFYRFSWDIEIIDMEKKLKLVRERLGRSVIFIYCCGDYDVEFDRVMKVRNIGHDVFIMRDIKIKKEKKYVRLARWTNSFNHFRAMSFKDFLKKEYNN